MAIDWNGWYSHVGTAGEDVAALAAVWSASLALKAIRTTERIARDERASRRANIEWGLRERLLISPSIESLLTFQESASSELLDAVEALGRLRSNSVPVGEVTETAQRAAASYQRQCIRVSRQLELRLMLFASSPASARVLTACETLEDKGVGFIDAFVSRNERQDVASVIDDAVDAIMVALRTVIESSIPVPDQGQSIFKSIRWWWW